MRFDSEAMIEQAKSGYADAPVEERTVQNVPQLIGQPPGCAVHRDGRDAPLIREVKRQA